VPDEVAPDDVPGQAALRLHLERYEFAADHLRPSRLLDIACGVGYGTRLMVDKNSSVVDAVGVDLSQEAIEHAQKRYGGERVMFRSADAPEFTNEAGFDSIVSLETLEHMPDPKGLIRHLVHLLRPEGVFIASVPTTPSAGVNPHHLHDFTESSFRAMTGAHGLRELSSLAQVQPYRLMRSLHREESRMRSILKQIVRYYAKHPRAFVKRLLFAVRHGFENRYLTVAWQKNA